jgi:hypothetical protein
VLELKYEEFVASPGEMLDRIYAFLELPAWPATRLEVRADINDAYFAQWRQDRGMRRLNRLWLALRYERRVRRFGYSLFSLG